MPHFGLMNPAAMPADQAALQRARLHIRSGRRRLQQGKVSAGVATLYDALIHGMEWRWLTLGRTRSSVVKEGENTADDRQLFRILCRGGYIHTHFNYDAFADLVYRAIEKDLPPDHSFYDLLRDIETVMGELGVMPFDETSLPPEDPHTF